MEEIIKRLIKYCKINTRSNPNSDTIPSSANQVAFALALKEELIELGLSEVSYNPDNGFVTATLESNIDQEVDTIGFIAHMDTADFNAENICPKVIENYDGKDIILNEAEKIVMKVSDFPALKNHVGKTLIVTDGLTLLGSDDKSGITEIIEAMRYFLQHPQIKHGKVRIAFGPDEEIGLGADHFDAQAFATQFAYTVDGGPLGELEYESFNAAEAIIKLSGVSVHPGSAKGVLVNCSTLACEFNSYLPSEEVPEQTSGYEGYYMLQSIKTEVEQGEMNYIIRDFDRQNFEKRKQKMLTIAKMLNEKYQAKRFEVILKDQYYNMREVIEKDMRCVHLAKKAMENLGITPLMHPIRGGTDGSKISFMGIPTPNLFTGGDNFHGRYEFAVAEDMVKAKETIIEIIKENIKSSKIL